MPASQSEHLTGEDLDQAKLALLGLRAPVKGGAKRIASDVVVGFQECLPNLVTALKQKLENNVVVNTGEQPLFQLEGQTPHGLNISAKARAFISKRNALDNEFHEWAQHAFPEAGCDPAAERAHKVPPKTHMVHKPAENELFVNRAVPVLWTASAGTDFVDVHVCQEKVLNSSSCVLLRSAARAKGFGEADNGLTLHIWGEASGRNKKVWTLQKPCKA